MTETQDVHIINKFREMVERRYQFDDLKNRYTLPPQITEDVIKEIQNYFLSSIYPPADKRKELEEAFKNLALYVRQPRKIWGLFGDMARALFKFGRHFFQALKAGMDSLDTFVSAKNFEESMARIANKNGIQPPMTDEDFEDCLYQLPRHEVEKFINEVRNLFGAMVNTVLLKKTLDILEHVIQTMEKNPKVYPKEDVDGIRLGKSLLEEGYRIFLKYDEPTKNAIVEFILQNELWFIDQVYKKKEEK